MKEIKFRAWDREYKKYNNNFHIVIYLNGEVYNQQDRSDGDNYVFEQYTGVKDKNGKEIYEGDILKAKDFECKVVRNSELAQFALKLIDLETGGMAMSFITHSEIIGNIHEGVKNDR